MAMNRAEEVCLLQQSPAIRYIWHLWFCISLGWWVVQVDWKGPLVILGKELLICKQTEISEMEKLVKLVQPLWVLIVSPLPEHLLLKKKTVWRQKHFRNGQHLCRTSPTSQQWVMVFFTETVQEGAPLHQECEHYHSSPPYISRPSSSSQAHRKTRSQSTEEKLCSFTRSQTALTFLLCFRLRVSSCPPARQTVYSPWGRPSQAGLMEPFRQRVWCKCCAYRRAVRETVLEGRKSEAEPELVPYCYLFIYFCNFWFPQTSYLCHM